MLRSRGLGRLGGLAVGLGIGAALAATAGTASADDIQISIDGIDLFPTAGNTATATSGVGDIAIALGASDAVATGGLFDSAFADGTAAAVATGGLFDSAFADGTDADADARGGSLDSATAVGNTSDAIAEYGNGDLASAVDTGSAPDLALAGGISANLLSSFDIASVLGTGSIAEAGSDATTAGNFDLAAVLFGDMLTSLATGGNGLVDIMPSL